MYEGTAPPPANLSPLTQATPSPSPAAPQPSGGGGGGGGMSVAMIAGIAGGAGALILATGACGLGGSWRALQQLLRFCFLAFMLLSSS